MSSFCTHFVFSTIVIIEQKWDTDKQPCRKEDKRESDIYFIGWHTYHFCCLNNKLQLPTVTGLCLFCKITIQQAKVFLWNEQNSTGMALYRIVTVCGRFYCRKTGCTGRMMVMVCIVCGLVRSITIKAKTDINGSGETWMKWLNSLHNVT